MAMERIRTAEPIHPGEFLRDELEARGMTGDQLAEAAELTPARVDAVVREQCRITESFASAISRVFDQDAATWMKLQYAYDQHEVRKKMRAASS